MVDRDAALTHHLLEVAVAHAIAAVPPDCPEYDLALEVTPLEVRHRPTPSHSNPSRRAPAGFATEPVPVLAISSAPQPAAKIRALQAGADDCVTAPFHKDELLARMHAIIRRSRGHSQAKLQVGPLQLNLDSRQVTVNGQEVHLTGKEYAILELLVLRKGMVLTKDAFLNHLYGGMDEPEMKIIDVFICKLRRKLADAGCGDLIRTIWGRGYVLKEPSAVEPVPESTWLPALTNRLVA